MSPKIRHHRFPGASILPMSYACLRTLAVRGRFTRCTTAPEAPPARSIAAHTLSRVALAAGACADRSSRVQHESWRSPLAVAHERRCGSCSDSASASLRMLAHVRRRLGSWPSPWAFSSHSQSGSKLECGALVRTPPRYHRTPNVSSATISDGYKSRDCWRMFRLSTTTPESIAPLRPLVQCCLAGNAAYHRHTATAPRVAHVELTLIPSNV